VISLETNIRIVSHGANLHLDTRFLVSLHALEDPDARQKVAARIGNEFHSACMPHKHGFVLIGRAPVKPSRVELADLAVDLEDRGALRLEFRKRDDRRLMATLSERSLFREVSARTQWWRFGGTFRTWHDPVPVRVAEDIAAYRRFGASGVSVDGVGIGLAVDVTTTFFTTKSVAEYFARGDKEGRSRFEFLTSRQRRHKGTLRYDRGSQRHKCYFDQFCEGITAGTTGPIVVAGKTFPSLFDYIRATQPGLPVDPADPVARVSFIGIDRPQYVLARQLFARVGTEQLPRSFAEVDKLAPAVRKSLVFTFWKSVGERPLGRGLPELVDGLWQPEANRVSFLQPPSLQFKTQLLDAPLTRSKEDYRQWFRCRGRRLDGAKAFYVPPTAARRIHFAAPSRIALKALEAVSVGICDELSRWSGIKFSPVIAGQYSTLEEGLAKVHQCDRSGICVFVFEDVDPASYFEIEYNLKGWRVKRITAGTLCRKFRAFEKYLGAEKVSSATTPRELQSWNTFVRVCALDVFQKVGALPWRVEPISRFEGELSIDVGEDRRQFAVSLLINRKNELGDDFSLETITEWKADVKHEAINPEALKTAVLKIFRSARIRSGLGSLAIFRDGALCGEEPQALDEALEHARFENRLATDCVVARFEVHKSGAKNVRIWQTNGTTVENALEGVAVRLDEHSVLLCTTGGACLTQGCADPILLSAQNGSALHLQDAAEHFFHSAQMNYSSPGIAQRLAAGLKRTDEELKARAAQEISRMK
jgi:hypothetical protein